MKQASRKLKATMMKPVDRYLPHGSFGRKVFIMLTGTVAGQMISVLLSPVLTRIYTPEEFGALGSFSALIMVLSVAAMLRYEFAIPLTKTKSEESNLIALCFLILSVFTAIMTFVLAFACPQELWEQYFVYPHVYRWLLPIGFFAVSAYQILVYVATKQDDFKTLSKTKLYQGAAGPFTQIGLGLSGVGTLGLIVGFVVGQSTGITILFSKLIVKTKAMQDDISWANMKKVGARFIRFPKVSVWSGIIGMLSSRMMLFLVLPVLYSPVIAGLVFLTDRVIARPLTLLTTSIMQVYFGDIAKSVQKNPANIKSRFLKLSVQQVVVVGGWLVLINLVAPFVFAPVFGPEWGDAVPYLQVLSISYFAQMVMMPLLHTLQALELHGRTLAWQIFHAVMVIGSFIVGFYLKLEPLEGLLLYSVCKFTAQGILYIIIFHAIFTMKPATEISEGA